LTQSTGKAVNGLTTLPIQRWLNGLSAEKNEARTGSRGNERNLPSFSYNKSLSAVYKVLLVDVRRDAITLGSH